MDREEAFEQMSKIIKLCRDDAKGEKNVIGTVICPVCENKVDYSIAHNGHIHAHCKTDDCISIMM